MEEEESWRPYWHPMVSADSLHCWHNWAVLKNLCISLTFYVPSNLNSFLLNTETCVFNPFLLGISDKEEKTTVNTHATFSFSYNRGGLRKK